MRDLWNPRCSRCGCRLRWIRGKFRCLKYGCPRSYRDAIEVAGEGDTPARTIYPGDPGYNEALSQALAEGNTLDDLDLTGEGDTQ